MIKPRIYKFLKWTERYTRTDMQYLAAGGFWMSSKRVVYAVTGLGVAFVFANFFPQEGYGMYKYALSMAGLFAMVSMSGINTAYLRSVVRGKEGAFYDAFRSRFFWGGLGSVFSLCASGFYYLEGNIELAIAFLISSLFLPVLNASTLFIPLLNGRKDFKLSAKFESLIQISASCCIVLTVMLTKDVLWILFVYFFSYSALRLIAILLIEKFHAPNKDSEYGIISYGKHLSIMGAFGDVASKIDSILLWHFLGAAPLAVYSFALVPTKHLRSLFKSASLLAFIKFSDKNKTVIKKTLPRKLFLFFLLVLVIVALYILAAPYIFHLLFPKYLDSIIYTQAMSLNLLFFPKGLLESAVIAHAKTRTVYFLRTSGPVFNIIVLFVLLPFFGIWGAIVSSLLTQVFKSVVFWIVFKKM